MLLVKAGFSRLGLIVAPDLNHCDSAPFLQSDKDELHSPPTDESRRRTIWRDWFHWKTKVVAPAMTNLPGCSP